MASTKNNSQHHDDMLDLFSRPLGFGQELTEIAINNTAPSNEQLLKLFVSREISDLVKGYTLDEAADAGQCILYALNASRNEINEVIEHVRAVSALEGQSNSVARVFRQADWAYHSGEAALDDPSIKRDERGDTLADYLSQVLFTSVDALRQGATDKPLAQIVIGELEKGAALIDQCHATIKSIADESAKPLARSKNTP